MFPRSRFANAMASGCAAGVMVLSGCAEDPDAGTNQVGKLPPKVIAAKTRQAADEADSLQLTGTVVSKGRKFRLDMRLKEDGGVGQVTSGSSTFELLRVGKELYLKADEEFYLEGDGQGSRGGDAESRNEGASAARKLEGKYVKVPGDDPSYDQLRTFTDMDALLKLFFTLDGELAVQGRGKVRGIRTVVLTAGGGRGATVEVALEGKPYPLLYKRPGHGGTIEMRDYDQEFSLRKPGKDQVVDYGKQVSAAGRS